MRFKTFHLALGRLYLQKSVGIFELSTLQPYKNPHQGCDVMPLFLL